MINSVSLLSVSAGSQQEKGYFGPWIQCIYLTYGREKCDYRVSRFQPIRKFYPRFFLPNVYCIFQLNFTFHAIKQGRQWLYFPPFIHGLWYFLSFLLFQCYKMFSLILYWLSETLQPNNSWVCAYLVAASMPSSFLHLWSRKLDNESQKDVVVFFQATL